MKLSRRKVTSFLLAMAFMVLVIWWRWPREPSLQFVRFEQYQDATWAVVKVSNQTDRSFYFTGESAIRLRTDGRWQMEESNIQIRASELIREELRPGQVVELSARMNHTDGTPIQHPFQAGVEMVGPPTLISQIAPEFVYPLLPATSRPRSYYWSEMITP